MSLSHQHLPLTCHFPDQIAVMREDLNCLPAFDLKLSSFMSYNTTFSEKVGRILINTLFCHHHFKDRLASVGIPQKHISWHPSHVCKTHCGRGTWSWEGVQQKWEESKKLGQKIGWSNVPLLGRRQICFGLGLVFQVFVELWNFCKGRAGFSQMTSIYFLLPIRVFELKDIQTKNSRSESLKKYIWFISNHTYFYYIIAQLKVFNLHSKVNIFFKCISCVVQF